MTFDACGVLEHDDDCLCDVHVTEAVEVLFSPVDMDAGLAVMQVLGVAPPWTAGAILDVLESMVALHDAVHDRETVCKVELVDGRLKAPPRELPLLSRDVTKRARLFVVAHPKHPPFDLHAAAQEVEDLAGITIQRWSQFRNASVIKGLVPSMRDFDDGHCNEGHVRRGNMRADGTCKVCRDAAWRAWRASKRQSGTRHQDGA